MKLQFFLCFLVIGLCTAQVPTSGSQSNDGQNRASLVTTGLYVTLRNVAFPEHKLTDTTPIDSRFLMLMPGKVLNYFDYYPGGEYTRFIQDLDVNNAEAVVPPHVMEKWFDIADAIPNYNPMNAQDTGKSLASVYSSILHESKLTGLEAKTNSERAIYIEAMNFLNESVADPDNTSVRIPRLALYERYRDLYNARKLEMEDVIDEKRRSVRALDYELWFQRHYPSLQSRVESAYTKWLIFGEKENVELYITYMDTGSSGTQLEQARMSLRASAVTSLDRTRTIYPVSFEPSDWYKYLLPEQQMPSRDQLQLMYGKLQSKIVAIDEMINVTNSSNINIASVKSGYDAKLVTSKTKAMEYMNYQVYCLGLLGAQPCPEYDDKRTAAIDAMLEEAEAFSTYQFAAYYKNPKDYIKHLTAKKEKLSSQARRIEGYLDNSDPYLGGLLDASPLAVSNLTFANRDSQWLQFNYDFDSYFNSKDAEATTESIQASAGIHVLFWSAGGSYSYNKQTSKYNEKLAKARLRVNGEMLRVNIKRPWFKPEVFEIPDLTYKETGNGGESFVSPGPSYSESQFFDILTSNPQRQFKLPEYTTGFLLARNIELEFSGLDTDTVTSTMHEMSHTSGGGGFLCFRASYSKTKTKDTSHVQVKRTASGMSIKIPGAQVIGYYTKLLPKFPLNQ